MSISLPCVQASSPIKGYNIICHCLFQPIRETLTLWSSSRFDSRCYSLRIRNDQIIELTSKGMPKKEGTTLVDFSLGGSLRLSTVRAAVGHRHCNLIAHLLKRSAFIFTRSCSKRKKRCKRSRRLDVDHLRLLIGWFDSSIMKEQSRSLKLTLGRLQAQ